METIFEKSIYEKLHSRLLKVTEDTHPLWGKMNPGQIMRHLNLTMEVPLGKQPPSGKAFFLFKGFKSVFYNDKPFGKGSPTSKKYKVTGDFSFAKEKQKVLENLSEIFKRGESSNYKPHVFFGALTGKQWGKHFYKHLDHHLNQFGV